MPVRQIRRLMVGKQTEIFIFLNRRGRLIEAGSRLEQEVQFKLRVYEYDDS